MATKPKKRRCQECGEAVPPASKRTRYCSLKCQGRHNHRKAQRLGAGIGNKDRIHPEVVASRRERIEQMKRLASAGLSTTLRLSPDLLL